MPRAKLRARVLRRGRELEIEGALEYPGPPVPGPPEIDSEAIRAAYREGQRWGWWQGYCHALGRDPNAGPYGALNSATTRQH